MFKLLRNYIREQKHNLLQLFGLGFLVIVMIVSFLALNFSNNYVKKQYVNNTFFDQDVSFNLESGNFFYCN